MTMGDPAGVGPESNWHQRQRTLAARLCIFAREQSMIESVLVVSLWLLDIAVDAIIGLLIKFTLPDQNHMLRNPSARLL